MKIKYQNLRASRTLTRILSLGSSIALLALLNSSAGLALADTIDYVVTGAGVDITFSLPSQPTGVVTTAGQGFAVNPMSLLVNGTPSSDEVGFYLSGSGGGLIIFSGTSILIAQTGPQLFSGAIATPTMLTFTNQSLTDYTGTGTPQYSVDLTLSAADVPAVSGVPEPVSFTLAGIGLLVMGVFPRRRPAQAV